MISFLLLHHIFYCIYKLIYSWEAYLRSRVRASQKFSSASTPHLQHASEQQQQQQHDIQHSQVNGRVDSFHDQHDGIQANKPSNR